MPGERTRRPPPVKREPTRAKFREAVAAEQALGEKATAIRAQHVGQPSMDRALYLELLPLLREPIPEGLLLKVSAGEGKPYESTGVRSVQVQMDRLDCVLTPLAWGYHSEFHNDGRLCHVTVSVFASDGEVLVSRDSWGGVERGSTTGNLYKSSFTNAAKQAFARIGPGHEVYVGATDHDPDVDPVAARQQARAPRSAQVDQGADDDAALAMLLATKGAGQAARREANEAMQMLGVSAGQRLRELKGAGDDPRALGELTTRAHAAADARAAADEAPPSA